MVLTTLKDNRVLRWLKEKFPTPLSMKFWVLIAWLVVYMSVNIDDTSEFLKDTSKFIWFIVLFLILLIDDL